jgi:fumarate reductase flavoprotein subunit
MGGVRVNKDGEAYNMAGLFAAGESSCWDMHGFNRLGGNSLAETIVAGRIVGRNVAQRAATTSLDVDTSLALRAIEEAEQRARQWLERSGSGPSVYELRDAMAETMIADVGIFRTEAELEQGVTRLRQLLAECDRAVLRSKVPGMNPELSFALRLKGMLRLSYVTAMGALARTESRGAHFRTDYPLRDDENWLSRTLVRWPDGAAEPTFDYEPVGLIDLPPGHRGYGSDERKEMQRSPEDYNAEVDQQQQQHGKLETLEPQGSRMRWGAWAESA